MRLPGRGSNLGHTTNQEPHDSPWFDARGLNPGHQVVMPGGAPLRHLCDDRKYPYIYGLSTNPVNRMTVKDMKIMCIDGIVLDINAMHHDVVF